MKIEEMNALRAQYREPVIETLEATFPDRIRRVPHTNDLYLMTNAPDGHPQEVKISVGVPIWIDTEKTKAFCYEDAVAKAEAEFAEKEAKKAENAKKRSETPVSKKVDNTAYDAKVLSFLSEHEEPISVADLFSAHEWDEENKETKGKLISALSRLNREGKVNKIDGKPSAKWTVA